MSYYLLNKHRWQKGGIYYKYKPKISEGHLQVNHGQFLIYFD